MKENKVERKVDVNYSMIIIILLFIDVTYKVYVLTGFMDAHRCAEEAIPLYLGEQEGKSNDMT